MKGYRKYFSKKIKWFLWTFVIAIVLNFMLPRLMPIDPYAITMARMGGGPGVYKLLQEEFGYGKPINTQFNIYVRNLLNGDFGLSIKQWPRSVSDIIGSSIMWTLALQLPAIIVGWFVGNIVGALAAYIRKGFDKLLMPVFLFMSGIPAFGMAVILLLVFALGLKIAPIGGLYDFDLFPNFSLNFIISIIRHYQLPFFSIVLVFIGGQVIGMRSIAIYELNTDYIKYSRILGIKDRKIVRYVFRNSMLPQVSNLALSLGTMMSGALVSEIVFSYPGLGSVIYHAVISADYPLLSAATLTITLMVLASTFIIDIIYGFIDPRVKAAQYDF